MKRICLILALVILCPVILCACGSADSIAKDYIEARYIDFDASGLSGIMLEYDKDLLREYVKDFDSASINDMIEDLETDIDEFKDSAEENSKKYDYKIVHTESYKEDDSGFKTIAKQLKNYDKSLSNAMTAAANVYVYLSYEYEDYNGEMSYDHNVVTVTCVKVDGKWYVLSADDGNLFY